MARISEPVLATALWDPKRSATSSPRPQLPTNRKSIDSALQGGLQYGSITCISAEADSGARDLTQALLVSHLLSASDANATVIDTGQALDVRRLYRALTDKTSERGDPDSKTQAKAALDRVKLMKTFDFEGLTESVAEMRDMLEGRRAAEPATGAPSGTIPDSQADDDDEMLDEPETQAPPPQRKTTQDNPPSPHSPDRSDKNLLIIDSLTALTAPLLKSNHASGQALLTAFLPSLKHVTRTHNLCTIMVNSTIPINAKGQAYGSKDESPSAFASCTARPALGKTLGYLVDVHLLVHLMPRKGEDARAVYGVARVENEGRGKGEMVSVLEVIQDRSNGRVGRWAAFTVDEGGKLGDVT